MVVGFECYVLYVEQIINNYGKIIVFKVGKKVFFGLYESGVQFFWFDDNFFFVIRVQLYYFGIILSKVLNGMFYFGIIFMFIYEIYKNVF